MPKSDDKRVKAARKIQSSTFRRPDAPRGFVSLAHEPSPPYVCFLGELMLTFALACGAATFELCFVQYLYPDDASRDGRPLQTEYSFGRQFVVVEATTVLHRPDLFKPPLFRVSTTPVLRSAERFVLCSDVYAAF